MYCTSLSLLLLLVFLAPSQAQEQLGLRTERYAGINAATANPANTLSYPLKWDVNLVAVGHFTETNYGYFQDTKLSEILRNTDNIYAASQFTDPSEINSSMIIFDYFDNERRKFVSSSTFVTGPSFMAKVGNGHAIGLFTNLRVGLSSQNIPWQLGFPEFDRTAFGDPIDVPAFDVAGMTWVELGLNYAFSLPTPDGQLGFGINLKFLRGYEAFTFNNNERTNLTQFVGDSVAISDVNFTLGITTTNNGADDIQIKQNGGGVAIDLGVTKTFFETEDGYELKLGLSLIDFGRVKLREQAELHRFQIANPIILRSEDYEDLETREEVIDQFNNDVLGAVDQSLAGSSFNVWLPAAISLQADYNFRKNFYVNGTLIQRLPGFKNSIRRGNLLAITPRFEHRWVSAFVPISLYNWQKLHYGFAVRLAFLTIGSDNIGSILGESRWTGTDFYMALRVNPFQIGWGGGGGSRRRGKSVKCYEF